VTVLHIYEIKSQFRTDSRRVNEFIDYLSDVSIRKHGIGFVDAKSAVKDWMVVENSRFSQSFLIRTGVATGMSELKAYHEIVSRAGRLTMLLQQHVPQSRQGITCLVV
jgi:hypothetical protein